MTPYLLHDLVRVRQHREEQAGEAVARARRRLHEARTALTQAEKDLEDYTVWRGQEERRKLDALMRRLLRTGELTDVRQEIALLREREFEFVDRVKKAEADVEKAATELDECRQKHARAVRELEKLLAHRSLWQHARAREIEHAEELEIEDFSSPARALSTTGGHYERN